MDCKWYRFDFEYVLPQGLPSSFKEPEAKLVYFATGSVVQPDGPEIETFDTKFHIRGIVDIDVFPRLWHEPTERRVSKTYPVVAYEVPALHSEGVVEDDQLCHTHYPNIIPNHSAMVFERSVEQHPPHSPPSHDSYYYGNRRSVVTENGEIVSGGGFGDLDTIPRGVDAEEEDCVVPQLFAILWLNSQAFVVGEQVTCDVKIENYTHHSVECVLKLEQVKTID